MLKSLDPLVQSPISIISTLLLQLNSILIEKNRREKNLSDLTSQFFFIVCLFFNENKISFVIMSSEEESRTPPLPSSDNEQYTPPKIIYSCVKVAQTQKVEKTDRSSKKKIKIKKQERTVKHEKRLGELLDCFVTFH